MGNINIRRGIFQGNSLSPLLFAPVPYSASINKSSASHFGPIRVRIFRFAHLSWPTNRSLHKLQFNKLKRCFSLSNHWSLVQIIQSSLILLPYRYTVFLSCWFCFCCSDFSGLLPRHVARPVLSLYAIVSISSLYFCFTVFFKFLALRLHMSSCSVL